MAGAVTPRSRGAEEAERAIRLQDCGCGRPLSVRCTAWLHRDRPMALGVGQHGRSPGFCIHFAFFIEGSAVISGPAVLEDRISRRGRRACPLPRSDFARKVSVQDPGPPFTSVFARSVWAEDHGRVHPATGAGPLPGAAICMPNASSVSLIRVCA